MKGSESVTDKLSGRIAIDVAGCSPSLNGSSTFEIVSSGFFGHYLIEDDFIDEKNTGLKLCGYSITLCQSGHLAFICPGYICTHEPILQSDIDNLLTHIVLLRSTRASPSILCPVLALHNVTRPMARKVLSK